MRIDTKQKEIQRALEINNAFDVICEAFDRDMIGTDQFLTTLQKYNEITKGDPSHGGKLVKKQIIDKLGHKETEWVKRNQDEDNDKQKQNKPTLEPVKHSASVLEAFAKETPTAELKRVINESSDEKLRTAARAELDRRAKKEKSQIKKETWRDIFNKLGIFS